jgi:hypothetical protein
MNKWHRIILMTLLALALVAPTLGLSSGPPWDTSDTPPNQVITSGCTCHGGGVPSKAVIVSISGVPQSYTVAETYNFTISLTTSDDAVEGGFLLWSYGVGTFNSDADGIRANANESSAISQSKVGNDWLVQWIAPGQDVGEVSFQLVGNAVDGSGLPDEGDAWNIVSFFIAAPGTATVSEGDELSLRTISVGDYESLFVAEVTAEEIEAEHQEELSAKYFEQGNLYYWSTFAILLIGAVFQREFYEKKYGGGPPHLDSSLALPQGIGRGVAALVMLYLTIYMYQHGWGNGWVGVVAMLFLWAAYGVYRTILQGKTPPEVLDLL